MPKNHGISEEQWSKCDRCGFVGPMSTFTRQLGMTLCVTQDCVDNLITMRRPQMIAAAMADTTEFQSDLAELVQDPGEVAFDD